MSKMYKIYTKYQVAHLGHAQIPGHASQKQKESISVCGLLVGMVSWRIKGKGYGGYGGIKDSGYGGIDQMLLHHTV